MAALGVLRLCHIMKKSWSWGQNTLIYILAAHAFQGSASRIKLLKGPLLHGFRKANDLVTRAAVASTRYDENRCGLIVLDQFQLAFYCFLG